MATRRGSEKARRRDRSVNDFLPKQVLPFCAIEMARFLVSIDLTSSSDQILPVIGKAATHLPCTPLKKQRDQFQSDTWFNYTPQV